MSDDYEFNVHLEHYTVHKSTSSKSALKVEYHPYANENPLKTSEKIAYVGQSLMYPIMKIIIPYRASFFQMPLSF